MAHLQYIPGDPRLVDQLVYELKSKGIFDQFRKDCIADVDTRPAYQNLRQRVENSVSTFLARQCWQPDLNKNQLREKLRKHILDGNYLEQGVERIVDQVVNPKVASVFIPQVEDLVYNYLGIARKKTIPVPETSNGKVPENNLLPTDLEAVSPGSVNDEKIEDLDIPGVDDVKMDIDQEDKSKHETKEENEISKVKIDAQDTQMSGISEPISIASSGSMDKSSIPLPEEEIKLENIPAPENSPPKAAKMKIELEKIQLPEEPNVSTDIPLPEETFKPDKEHYFKPVNSDDDDSSSDSSLRRNMSPLTPIRNFNNENSCDAQQAFDNDSEDSKTEKKEIIEPNTFRFTIESKNDNSSEDVKPDKKDTDQANLSYQFNNQVNINAFNTPMYDDSSNSNLLHIDYESDANSKINLENKLSEADQNSNESKKDKKQDEKKSSHRSSSHHKDSHRHSSSKDRRSDSKQSSSRDSRSAKKSSKDEHKSSSKSSNKERSSDRSDKKESRDSSKHRSSHKSSSSSTNKDSKSHRSSSSSQRHSSSKHSDDKKSSSSSHRDKEKSSKDDKHSKEKSVKDSKSSSSSHRSDKDRKSSSSSKSKHEDKDKKKEKKDTDDHYSASGRGSHTRRSTDRDSNDGSSSSKGSHNPSSAKSLDSKKESKGSTSKSDNTSTSGDSASPSDKDHLITELKDSRSAAVPQSKPVIRVDNHLEVPILSLPRLPFVPDITLKKPKIAANLEEARRLMKMRKFLDEEQKRMNQEAALLLEFQANVRPSMSQVYSSIPGPELEFACVTAPSKMIIAESQTQSENNVVQLDNVETRNDSISDILNAAQQVESIEVSNETENQTPISITETVKDNNETTKPVIVEMEKEEEVSETGKATVHIENSVDNIFLNDEIQSTPIEDKNIQIINILSTADESDESQISEIEIEKTSQDNIVENDEFVEIKETNKETGVKFNVEDIETDDIEMKLSLLHEKAEYSVQVTVIAEEVSDGEEITLETVNKDKVNVICEDESPLEYFGETEKYNAELERDQFSKFLKAFTESCTQKMYLINCETYEENIVKEVLQNLGTYEIVNYYKNGHLKLNSAAKNVVKNVNVSSEISLPSKTTEIQTPLLVFSPVKSECSFELSSDYDAKLEEMVSKTSRKEIMEIILGNTEESATDVEMPTIDYCNDSNIESDTENTVKRKYCEVESSENNNRQVLTPNKIRKMSDSEQITSTTGESEETSNNNVTLNTSTVRSKYLGRARRVGLPRPRRSNLPNSPSSDKSIENYEQNTPVAQTPNGKIKTPRNKVQRYDTSDLYKPKLHYLSRRNNIS